MAKGKNHTEKGKSALQLADEKRAFPRRSAQRGAEVKQARTAQKRKGSTHGVRKTARAKPLASLARQIRPNERHAGGEQTETAAHGAASFHL